MVWELNRLISGLYDGRWWAWMGMALVQLEIFWHAPPQRVATFCLLIAGLMESGLVFSLGCVSRDGSTSLQQHGGSTVDRVTPRTALLVKYVSMRERRRALSPGPIERFLLISASLSGSPAIPSAPSGVTSDR
ncbi:hypothetical protein LZ31DRAFT_64533 [Colletotrichum somersetense]|nr:hypothetical protein LZ31DRAFT_64533 [Colletotrichum somersetense]